MRRLGLAVMALVGVVLLVAPEAQAIFLDNYVYEEGGSWYSTYSWQATRYRYVGGVKTNTLENFTFDRMLFTICWPETQDYDGTGVNPYVTIAWAKQGTTNLTWTRKLGSPDACLIEGPALTGSAGQIRFTQKFTGASAPPAGLHIYQRAYGNGVLKEFGDLRLKSGNALVENYRDYGTDIPEPSSIMLLIVGVGLAAKARRRK